MPGDSILRQHCPLHRLYLLLVCIAILVHVARGQDAPADHKVWEREYPSHALPSLTGLTLTELVPDESGSVYVTGAQRRSGEGSTLITAKYSRQGRPIWIRRHDRRTGVIPRTIRTGGAQYLFVLSRGDDGDFVANYNRLDGSEIWDRTLPDPELVDARPQYHAIASDASGNLYATGGVGSYVVTTKLNASGEVEWLSTFEDPYGAPIARGRFVGVDDSRHVFVGVQSQAEFGGDPYDNSYTILKYDPSGDLRAVTGDGQELSRIHAMHVGDDGTVTLAGSSGDPQRDMPVRPMTVRLSAELDWQWRRYCGADVGSANDLSVDAAGNVYVAARCRPEGGTSYAVFKYDADGEELWLAGESRYGRSIGLIGSSLYVQIGQHSVSSFDPDVGVRTWETELPRPYEDFETAYPTDLAIDADGNAVVGVMSNELERHWRLFRFATDGNWGWSLPYIGIHRYRATRDMTISSDGSIYLVGDTESIEGDRDFLLLKYDPAGELQWERTFDGPAGGDDLARFVELDSRGHVIVGGWSAGIDTGRDFAVVKYDPNGEMQWSARLNGPGSDNDNPTDMAVDRDDGIYMVGGNVLRDGSSALTTVRFRPSGDVDWVRRFQGSSGGSDYATALELDTDGNAVVTGVMWVDVQTADADFVTIQYDPTGQTVWTATLAGPSDGYDAPADLAITPVGDVYVAGDSENDIVTVKYDGNGVEQWRARYDNPAQDHDLVRAITIDDAEAVYVVGESTGSGTGYDLTTIKYGPDGERRWVSTYNGPGNGLDRPTDILADESGGLYIGGWTEGGEAGDELLVLRYGADGAREWTLREPSPEGDNRARALETDSSGNLFVAGRTGTLAASQIRLSKFAPPGSVSSERPHPSSRTVDLSAAYPNPFSSSVSMELTTGAPVQTRIRVFDILGREVAVLMDEQTGPGSTSVEWMPGGLAPGVYLLHARIGDATETRELVHVP